MFAAMRDASAGSLPIFGFNFIGQANVSIDGQPPMPAGGMLATSEYFPVMGLAMAAGRPFAAADDRPDAARVVVISYGLWMRAFGGDRSAIGRTIRVSGDAVRGHRRHGAGLSRAVTGRTISTRGRDVADGRAA